MTFDKNRTFLCSMVFVALTACQPGEFGLGTQTEAADPNVAMVDRDVEAPEVYQTTDPALWDGRPSLGGVWVAAPGVSTPERVIIRNPSNNQSVIGSLFKRERINPGPPLQLSSDAAAALGILAGQPTEISVTALRTKSIPDPEGGAASVAATADGTPAPQVEVDASALQEDDFLATASDAIASAENQTAASVAAELQAAPAPTPQPVSNLSKPFVQIGIFSVESNARNTANRLRSAGLVPTVLAQNSRGKPFWRVIVGPSPTASDRASVLRKVKGLGFGDAYAVTN